MPAAIPAVAAESVLAAEVMATEAAAAAAAEAAAVEAAQVAAADAAAQAAATAAAEQAATTAGVDAATTAGAEAATQAATTGAADLATQEAVRAQLAANAGQTGLPSIAPQLSPLQPTGIESLGNVANVNASQLPAVNPPAAPAPTPPVSTAPPPAAPSSSLYELQAPGYQGMNAPMSNTTPSQYSLGNQMADYKLAGSVPSPAATQTAGGTPNMFDTALNYIKDNKIQSASLGLNALNMMNQKKVPEREKYKGPLSKFKFNPDVYEPYTPQPPTPYQPRMYYAGGGISSLGGYSDGGRMLKGPGDGMSDDIPATIAGKQPARLANEEFVVPADVVSHLGNGSSEAGAKVLYKMMDRVRQARTGNKKQGKQINPEKYLA